MSEHRLIEKMVQLVKRESEKTREEGKIDPKFVDFAVDFFRTYADKCHHVRKRISSSGISVESHFAKNTERSWTN